RTVDRHFRQFMAGWEGGACPAPMLPRPSAPARVAAISEAPPGGVHTGRGPGMACTPGPLAAASPGLVDAHVPVDQPADLPLGIAALDHAADEFCMLLLGGAVLLRAEADHRQEILHLAEHPLLDHLAQLLVAGPGRVAAAVLRPRPEREF